MLQFDGLVCLSALPVLKTKKDALQKIISLLLYKLIFSFVDAFLHFLLDKA